MIQKQGANERKGLTLLGVHVCQFAFRHLLGLGKQRFQRIRNAVLNEEAEPPVDERFRPQRFERLSSTSVRPALTEWFQQAWHRLAEPLPEAFEAEATAVVNVRRRGKRPRHLHKFDPAGKKGHHEQARFLPPGTIVEYLELARRDLPHLSFGRKIFTRVP